MEFRGRRDASREKEDGARPMRNVKIGLCCSSSCWCDHSFSRIGFSNSGIIVHRLSITR